MELPVVICYFIALVHIINAGIFGDSGDRTFTTYCEWTAPFFGAPTIHRYEGKFNVPMVPKEYQSSALFLWPGVNPEASQHGLMQPVLGYYSEYVPTGTWGMSNWFSNCDPSISTAQDGQYFCWDDFKVVQEGDTILFYMQYIETFRNGSQHWEMGWSSYNNKSYGQTKQCYRVTNDVGTLWATEAEFYIDSSDSANFNKLPSSTFYTWDIVAYTSSGSKYDLSWDTINKDPQPGKSVDCNVNVPIHGQSKTGSAIYFPNNNGCTLSGYSRDWNSNCADYCGCKNAVDGSAKVQCDYCCYYNRLTAKCNREDGSGPSYDFNDYTEDAYTKDCNDGYSRKWDYGCQSACGCNNDDDTPKNMCDYCCALKWYKRGGYDYCDAQIPNTPSPTKRPTTMKPSRDPTTPNPTPSPIQPTKKPTTDHPTRNPSPAPVTPTKRPTTMKPSRNPTSPNPTPAPIQPTKKPTTDNPTRNPSVAPIKATKMPSKAPISKWSHWRNITKS